MEKFINKANRKVSKNLDGSRKSFISTVLKEDVESTCSKTQSSLYRHNFLSGDAESSSHSFTAPRLLFVPSLNRQEVNPTTTTDAPAPSALQPLPYSKIKSNHGIINTSPSISHAMPQSWTEMDPLWLSRIGSLDHHTPARVAYWRMLQERQSDLTARIKIHSNILPREAYRQKLFQELQQQSFWTRLQSLIRGSSCFVNRRWFYPSRVLAEAVEEERSLKEKMQEWSKEGGTCVLAMHLRRSNVPHAVPRERLRDVELAEVKLTTEKLGEGGEGSVYKVSWRNGTYAWKSFDHGTFERECEIALRILHPHIVHPFGRTSDVDGNHKCLLMEVMSEDLSRFAVEKKRCDAFDRRPLFSRVDTLDVLRQIASAMQFLHSRSVVHGDLKPSNILISHFEISDNSRHFLAKITDFGNAQFIVSGERFKPGGPGTTRYAAPEVLEWRKKAHLPFLYPKKLDVYSFGVVVFEVLTGHAAYNGHLSVPDMARVMKGGLKPSHSIEWARMRRRYPVELIRRLESCWELDPRKRPSFLDLCEVLQRSKSKMQLLERKAADLWNFLAVCCSAFVIVFIALWLQRYAGGVLFS